MRANAAKAAKAATPPEERNGDEAARLDMTALSGLVGFMVRVVQLQMFKAYYDRFGKDGLTTGAFSVLTAIRANPGVRQGALASAMMIKRSNMTKLVQSLERAGLVSRRAADGDGRSINLDLTVKGRRLIDRLLPQVVAYNRDVTGALSVHERQILLALLGKLYEEGQART